MSFIYNYDAKQAERKLRWLGPSWKKKRTRDFGWEEKGKAPGAGKLPARLEC